MSTKPSKNMERFENPYPKRAYNIDFTCEEFTCLCPKTGQPDFATLRISYVPNQWCVELKSLKLYFWSYRDEGAFHEAVANKIVDDLIELLEPRALKLEAEFKIRGGIHTQVTVCYPEVESPLSPRKTQKASSTLQQ